MTDEEELEAIELATSPLRKGYLKVTVEYYYFNEPVKTSTQVVLANSKPDDVFNSIVDAFQRIMKFQVMKIVGNALHRPEDWNTNA